MAGKKISALTPGSPALLTDLVAIARSGASFSLPLSSIAGLGSGVSSFNTRRGAVTLSALDVDTALGFTPYSASNPAGYISVVSGAMVVTALGFTPYNASNPAGYISGITSLMVSNALGFKPARGDAFASVFDFMTAPQIADVTARTFSIDVSAALIAAFAAGVSNMPAGGYLCSSSVTVSGAIANGIQIRGAGAADTEMRFPANTEGLVITFSDPQNPPAVMGLTISTLNLGAAVANTGLSMTMTPTVGTASRSGARVSDVVVRGADPTLHGWSTCIFLNGEWYPQLDDVTTKGFSASGAGLNTYQTVYGIHVNGDMVPRIRKWVCYHVNTPFFDDSTANDVEGLEISDFEMVGCNTGISIGNNVASPIPGGSIGPGHINCSFRGIVFNNRVQCEVHGVSFYRTPSTSLAWVGMQISNCDHLLLRDSWFENVSADTTGGNGIWLTGNSNYIHIHGIISDNWNAAGNAVLLDNTASNNIIDAYSISVGGTGTPWAKVTNVGTGTGNRINDTEAAITLLTANSATPSVDNSISGAYQTNNSVGTRITNLTGGYPGQVIQILVNDANTTFGNNGTTISMRPGQDYVANAGDVFTFRNYGSGLWREVSRNAQAGAFTTLSATSILDLSAAGAGEIKFPATPNPSVNPNTFDDFERGTWTPNVGGTATYTTQTGTFAKYASRAFIDGQLIINVLGTGSTGGILGAPFVASSVGTGCVGFFAGSATAYTSMAIRISSGGTALTLAALAAAAASMTTPATFFANGANIVFNASYKV